MSKIAKAITAFLTSAVGLAVAYGYVDDAQAQQLIVIATALVNLGGVYLVPNK